MQPVKLTKTDVSRALKLARAKRDRTIEYLCRAFLQFEVDSPDTVSQIAAFLTKHCTPSTTCRGKQ